MSKKQLNQSQQGVDANGIVSDTYLTPYSIVEQLPFILGPEYLDPCVGPVVGHTRASKVYDEQMDGLTQKWDMPAFVNPPFSQMARWVPKILFETSHPVLLLAKFDPRVSWCQTLVKCATQTRVMAGYTKFLNTSLEEGGSAMFNIGLYLINGDSRATKEFAYRFADSTFLITP